MVQPIIEAAVDTLIDSGVEYTFGVPGGGALFLYGPLHEKRDRITSILARHEGAAACMADAYGRITGKPAALIAQGAWAGSNAAFGILEAYLAGSPMVIIADTSDYGGLAQYGPWQNGTGEYGGFDLPGMMRAMTKYTTVATTPDELLHGIQLAARHAVTGRPGPACVLARMNLFGMSVDTEKMTPRMYPASLRARAGAPCLTEEDARRIAMMLSEAACPVMIAGRGVHAAKAYDEVCAIAELLAMPVTTSYMGKSAIAETHELALGTMGGIGQAAANEYIARADCILAVGTGLSPENTRMLAPGFIDPDRQKLIHIDIEALNAGWTYPATIAAASDAKSGLAGIIAVLRNMKPSFDRAARLAAVGEAKKRTCFFACDAYCSDAAPIAPERVVKELNDATDGNAVICLDAGNNRQWFAKHFMSKAPGQVLAPGGAGGVGWGPPAALAAQMLLGDRKVVGVCGDGGMIMMLHCLETAVQYRLPVTYVVLNNSVLGNIRDFQGQDCRYCTEYQTPDLAAHAKASGLRAFRVTEPAELSGALREALDCGEPSLVDIITAPEAHFKLMC
jgi:acetolactate synthase-1/2/3 large subunit